MRALRFALAGFVGIAALATAAPAEAGGGALSFVKQWTAGPNVGPSDVAVSDNGKVYVLIGGQSPRVRKYTTGGKLLDKWGGLTVPTAIDVAPDGRVWVAQNNGILRVFTGGGNPVDQWNPSNAGAIADVSVTGKSRVYLVDSSDSSVDRYKMSGTFLTEWFGDGAENFANAVGVAVDDAGSVFVTDSHQVTKFTNDGSFLDRAGGDFPSSSVGAFQSPARMDIRGQRVYIAEPTNHRVQRFTTAGLDFVAHVGGSLSGSDPGEFNEVRGVGVDPSTGRVFIPSLYDRRIQKFTP